jgi:hypothetical protein
MHHSTRESTHSWPPTVQLRQPITDNGRSIFLLDSECNNLLLFSEPIGNVAGGAPTFFHGRFTTADASNQPVTDNGQSIFSKIQNEIVFYFFSKTIANVAGGAPTIFCDNYAPADASTQPVTDNSKSTFLLDSECGSFNFFFQSPCRIWTEQFLALFTGVFWRLVSYLNCS